MIARDKPDVLSEYGPTRVVLRALMEYRGREVLLVSSLYDSYTLGEGGRPRCGDETSGAGERRIDGWPPHGGRILSGEAA